MPDPYPGESLLSWADALARLNQVSRTVALRMAGMADSSSVSDIFGYHVSDAFVRAVRHTTGVTEEQVRGMTLAHYAGRAPDPLPQHEPEGQDLLARWRYRQRMVLRQYSNACPACLRENRARWLLKWPLAWSFACVEHGRYLISTCRGCGAVLHL
ncbi:TniQ family protein [Streptomyces sp. NPDC002845]